MLQKKVMETHNVLGMYVMESQQGIVRSHVCSNCCAVKIEVPYVANQTLFDRLCCLEETGLTRHTPRLS